MSWKATSLFLLTTGLCFASVESSVWSDGSFDGETMDDEMDDEISYDEIDSLIDRLEKIYSKSKTSDGLRLTRRENDDEVEKFSSKNVKNEKSPKEIERNCKRWELC